MKIIFNIPLKTADASGVSLDPEAVGDALSELTGTGFFGNVGILEPHGANILIAEFDYAELRKARVHTISVAYRLCQQLNLAHVAVYNSSLDHGQLVGPGLHNAEFNRERFFLVNGKNPKPVVAEVLH